ncbi:MAG: triose-phosphate isomerase [Candidatus Staskawiczbacteria bacterium]|nr:triose-phosphate isomerase [Candidatus Staskawiczbacteria bacterium]
MKILIVANWKCNPTTLKEAKVLFNGIKKKVKSGKTEVVVCPPFVYLSSVAFGEGGFTLGAQDCFWEEKGAFTGEVSALQLRDLKIKYVIIGHSERRKYFNETDEQINKKIKRALSAKLKVILCIGETQDEQKSGKKLEVLEKQIRQGLQGVSAKEIKNIVIAYEPVWAIGAGNNCSLDQAESSFLFIRKATSNLYNRKIASDLKILYGGSVTSANAVSYIESARANGLLVGGASLKAEEFIKIVKDSAR